MSTDHVDVLIVGAGLSGISAACHLSRTCPGKTYAILEAREGMGGTWDLFKYPGIRSDSDMFTLGFSFRPWKDAKVIADGPAILKYIHDTAREFDVERHIRFGHNVTSAEWSSEDARWTLTAERADSGKTVEVTANFVFACTGYYRYDEGYTPDFPGIECFQGEVVHPQHWTDDVEYAGKRVVVIGSGATAVTLVPAMAKDAEHVTMLQRSPSYFIALPDKDVIADALRRFLPERIAHAAARWKNVMVTMAFYQLSKRRPKFVRGLLMKMAAKNLPPGYDVKKHFNPTYNPWDQRLCLIPDADLFKSIKRGEATVETDTIETFTERGIKLSSGTELEADLVITATGLNLQLAGGAQLTVDGKDIALSDTVSYKGTMLSGVPNMATPFGYTNASWTLKCELVCEYACRVINHMDAHGYEIATPAAQDPSLPTSPFVEDLTSGYVLRAIPNMPRQGVSAPWRIHQNYIQDIRMIRRGPLEDGMEFSRAKPATAAPQPERAAA